MSKGGSIYVGQSGCLWQRLSRRSGRQHRIWQRFEDALSGGYRGWMGLLIWTLPRAASKHELGSLEAGLKEWLQPADDRELYDRGVSRERDPFRRRGPDYRVPLIDAWDGEWPRDMGPVGCYSWHVSDVATFILAERGTAWVRDLATVTDAWPNLSEDVRRATIETARG